MNLNKSTAYRTKSVVLRRRDLGEADRIITLFTREHGKRSAVARGVRKPGSRLAGHVELFTVIDAYLIVGSNLDVLTQASSINIFPKLAEDLRHFAQASWASEIIDKLIPDSHPDSFLFDLLVKFLELATNSGDIIHLHHFELLALQKSGYQPQLDACAVCGEHLDPSSIRFSAHNGGTMCPSCPSNLQTHKLSTASVKTMRWLLAHPLGQASILKINNQLIGELAYTTRVCLENAIEDPLRSGELFSPSPDSLVAH
tara:strand:- start:2646 stop:3416 length:771 start_codon:yes stop_codon:yes gene_type:complete